MNITGKQKSQLLISLIEEYSTDVLTHLSEKSAAQLSSSLEDVVELDSNQMKDFLDHTLEMIHDHELKKTTAESMDDLESLDDLDVEEPEVEEAEPVSKYPDSYRTVDTIASTLSEQDDQMIAFFFAHVEEELGQDIKELMPEETLDRIAEHKVQTIPMSDRIFKKLFDSIVLKSAEELQAEQEASDEELDVEL